MNGQLPTPNFRIAIARTHIPLASILSPKGRGRDILRGTDAPYLISCFPKKREAHQTCHSAKRTHRFWRRNFVELTYVKILMTFAEEICRWVRFGKRTHRDGVLGANQGELPQKPRRSVSRSQCC